MPIHSPTTNRSNSVTDVETPTDKHPPAVPPVKVGTIPSIGRVVWYNNQGMSDQVCASIVVYVHSPHEVNLTVHDRVGHPIPVTNVPFYHGDDGKIPQGWCGWMPYQVQAAAAQASKKPGEAGAPNVPLNK
jgi:hypothetical protein